MASLTVELHTVQLFQLKDVYAIAQEVGEQFHGLIQQFGNSYLSDLVNTVVHTLELLETSVGNNQELQARTCKLLLDNDTLVKENQRLKVEAQKNSATLASVESEKKKLLLQLEAEREINNELRKNFEETACQLDRTYKENPESLHDDKEGRVEDINEGANNSPSHMDTKTDIMEIPRMKRRLAQMENELKRTRSKLLSAQSTLKCIVSENNVLKAQLEDSKAEIGLQSLQLTKTEGRCHGQESPKFFKKDLLAVLRERNELKEEVDSLRDELNLTKLQIRYQYHQHDSIDSEAKGLEAQDTGLQRTRSNTKVRDIVTSLANPAQKDKKTKKASRKSVS